MPITLNTIQNLETNSLYLYLSYLTTIVPQLS